MTRGHQWTWLLPADPTMVAAARRKVAAATTGIDRDTAEVALLLTSEVVTNALRYGRTTELCLSLTLRSDELVVEVGDDRPEQPRRQAPRQLDERGRGLILLDALASSWGTTAEPPGKVVWFRLTLTPPPAELLPPRISARS